MATVADIVARMGPPQDVLAYPDAREFDLVARAVPANDVIAYPTLPGTPPVATTSPGGAQDLDAPASALALAGPVPIVQLEAALPSSALALAGPAPAIAMTVDAQASTLTLAGPSPSVQLEADPASAALVLSGPAPSAEMSVDASSNALTLTGPAPSLAYGVEVGLSALSLGAPTPTLGMALDFPPSSLALTTPAPSLTLVVEASASGLTITGPAPSLASWLDALPSALALSGPAPILDAPAIISAPVAALALAGPAPMLLVIGVTPRQREALPSLDLRTARVGYDRTARTEHAARSGPVVGVPRASTTDVRYRLARAGYEGADMASFFWGTKDPDDVLDYAIDWTGALNGDTIATSVFVVASGAGMTIASQSNTTTSSTVWLSGGTAGTVYEVTCTITTAGARTFERTAQLTVADL